MCNEERDYSVDTEVFEAVEKLLKNRVETCVQKECEGSTSTKSFCRN